MNKQEVLSTLKKIKETSPKRNFKQSIELIINLKSLNLKRQESQLNIYASMPFSWGRTSSVCAFVGPELKAHAEQAFSETVTSDNFPKYQQDKKLVKKLAKRHDFFVAQANFMPQVATVFGRVLGPLGKMPNPKIGAVFPPNANLAAINSKLQKTKRLMSRANPIIQSVLGKEDAPDNEIAENAVSVYNTVLHSLPNDINNIKNVYLKLTMSPAVMIGEYEAKQDNAEAKSQAKPKMKEKEIKDEPKEEKPAGDKKPKKSKKKAE